jgi:hypothetical protein
MKPFARFAGITAFGLIFPFFAVAQQNCQLTNNQPQAIGAPPTPGEIFLSGNAPACDQVDLLVTCQRQITIADVSVVNGQWSRSLTLAEIQAAGCSCPGRMAVQATCKKGDANTCQIATKHNLQCQATKCPVISDITYAQPACSTTGSIPVTFSAAVTGNFNGFYRWTFDGQERLQNLGGTAAAPSSQTFTLSCPRTAPPYTVDLVAVGCPGGDPWYSADASKDVSFPACGSCPTIQPISVTPTSKCNVELRTSISGCGAGSVTEFNWDFGHSGSGGTQSTTVPFVTHTYPHDGTFAAKVTLGGVNAGACRGETQVTISGCGKGGEEEEECAVPWGCKPGKGGTEGCGWQFWNCISFNLCWVLAALAFALVYARIVLLAMYDFEVGPPPVNFTLDQLLTLLGLALLIAFLVICPCEVLWGILLGALAAAITVVGILIAGGAVPAWLKALIVSVVLIVVTLGTLAATECTK